VRRIAVIDIGTNTIQYLLVEEMDDGRIECVFQRSESVRLGERIDETGRIADAPLDKAVAVLEKYRSMAESHQAGIIIVVGTHVFRKAANRDEVLQVLLKKTGIKVFVLSENEEAEWSHRGAVSGRSFSDPVVSADIGGGSTEIVLGFDGRIMESASAAIGAVSLTEHFLTIDPPDAAEMAALNAFVAPAVEKQFGSMLRKAKQLIAVGGTATTLAALDLGLSVYDPKQVDGHRLTKAAVDRLLSELAGMDLIERKKRLAQDPKRADIIVAGTIILKTIMECGSSGVSFISDRGLRFGLALKAFKQHRG
jgi:exopolyphosphatase/guanosine-5'-triphosphate,3'-diphosphate pyrophosphatase